MKIWTRGLPLLVTLWIAVTGSIVGAYELRTHGEITRRAFQESTKVGAYLEAIGVKLDDKLNLRETTPSAQLGDFENTGTAQDWMIEGVIREDDYKPYLLCEQPKNPPSEIDRPFNHFFDVQNQGRGLTVALKQRGCPAPDWALGKQGRGPGATQNQFSILDARVYQLQSLTEPKKEDRERNTALLFHTLGHVAHVLQDMAQPQHTRNDAHAGCVEILGGEESWYETYMEMRALGIPFRGRSNPAPPLLLDGYPPPRFTLYRDFWTTRDFSRAVGQQGSDGKRGLADFSSRNFFSAGTNWSCKKDVREAPECLLDKYMDQKTRFSFQTVDDTTVAGHVMLRLGTVQDHLTGATIPNVALTSRSLWDQHLEAQSPGLALFSLNTLVYDAISALLLPRAVGYSTGLLDYFFRGKLQVDLSADPVDPSLLHVEGTNASPEPLDGVLTIYADYADDPNGNRVKVSTDFPLVANAGQAVASPTFQLTETAQEAERFVAVYQGTLGNERKDQEPNFPGAVIGKVFGGVRVEQVFSDGTRWQLRTPKGIFALPILAQDVEELRWGDRDNTLVGRSQLGQGAPNQFYAYEINRPVGSLEVPLKTLDQPEGSPLAVVDVQVRQQVPFPFGMDTGTTIRFGHTIRYQQYAPLVHFRRTLKHNGVTYVGPTFPSITGQWKLVVNESRSLQRDYPIILEAAGMTPALVWPSPYSWEVVEMSLTADGRILAVVRVESPREESTVPAFDLAGDGSLIPLAPITFAFSSPFLGPALWALVDVGNGAVVASTTPQILEINHQMEQTALHSHVNLSRYSGIPEAGITYLLEEILVGGPQDGLVHREHGKTFVQNCTPEQLSRMVVLAEVSAGSRTLQATVNQYRPELASLLPGSIEPTQRVEFLPIDCGREGVPASGFKVNDNSTAQSRNTLDQVLRTRPGASPEALVLLMHLEGPLSVGPDRGIVVQWIPEENRAEVRKEIAEPGFAGFHTVRSVSHSAVLVDSLFLVIQSGDLDLGVKVSGALVPLPGEPVARIFPDQSFFDFVVLEPELLYNVNDQYLGQLRKAEGRLRSMNTAQAGDLVENLGQ